MKKTIRIAILALLASVALFTGCNYDDQGVFEYVINSEPRDDRALNIIGYDSTTVSGNVKIFFKSKYGLESFQGGTYTTLDGSDPAKKSTLYSILDNDDDNVFDYIVYLTQDTDNGTLQTPINGVYVYDFSTGATEAAATVTYDSGSSTAFSGNPNFIIDEYIYCLSGKDTINPYKISVSGSAGSYTVDFALSGAITVSGYNFYDVDGNVLTFADTSSNKKYLALDCSTGTANALLSTDGNNLPCDDDVTVIGGYTDSTGATQYIVLQNDDYVQIWQESSSTSYACIHSRDITASNHLYTYFDDTYTYYNIPGYAAMYKVNTADQSRTSTDYSKLRNIDIAGYFPQGTSLTSPDYLVIATRDNGFYLLKSDLSSLSRY